MNIFKIITTSLAFIALPLLAEITVPNTFSNGQVADADEINANFDALVDGVNNPPVIMYSGSCASNPGAGSASGVRLCLSTDTVTTAVSSGHLSVNSNGVITALISGYYRLKSNILPAQGNASYEVSYVLRVNDVGVEADYYLNQSNTTWWRSMSVDSVRYLNTSDTVDFLLQHNTGSAGTAYSLLPIYNSIEIIYLGQ